MAWYNGAGTHQQRKEASAHLRAATNRAAIAERERPAPMRKRAPCHTRKFGIEWRWLRSGADWSEWLPHGWYETERRRDQAFDQMNKNMQPVFSVQYRKSWRA